MNLIEVKKYFEQHSIASSAEIAAHFNVAPLDIECYVTYWKNRGNLVLCNKSCDSGCNLCFQNGQLYYTWQDSLK